MTNSTDLLVVDGLDSTLPSRDEIRALRDRLREWEARYRLAQSPATLRAVRADWQVFIGWCERAGVRPLPLSCEDLARFLTDQEIIGKRRATLNRYVNTIRLVHRGANLPDPTSHPDWRLLWRGIVARLARRGGNAPRQAPPLRASDIETILKTLGDRPIDLRDAALIALASDTLCRESELVRIKLEDFSQTGDGWAVDVRRSKTDQEGLGSTRYCSPATKARIDAWCSRAGIDRGLIFIGIGRSRGEFRAPPPEKRTPLGPTEVARIIRRRAARAGLQDAHQLSGHSGRVGSAVDLLEAGFSVTDVQFAGGWKSPQMVLHYGKRALAGHNAMARLRGRRNT